MIFFSLNSFHWLMILECKYKFFWKLGWKSTLIPWTDSCTWISRNGHKSINQPNSLIALHSMAWTVSTQIYENTTGLWTTAILELEESNSKIKLKWIRNKLKVEKSCCLHLDSQRFLKLKCQSVRHYYWSNSGLAQTPLVKHIKK